MARPEQWGATPEARKGWALAHYDTRELEMLSIPASPPNPTELPSEKSQKYPEDTLNQLFAFFYKTPGFLIAITLNLFLSMSFGAAFFPQYWQDSFPHYIPRTALGVQMFLFSTFICQLTMTSLSDFPTAMGYFNDFKASCYFYGPFLLIQDDDGRKYSIHASYCGAGH